MTCSAMFSTHSGGSVQAHMVVEVIPRCQADHIGSSMYYKGPRGLVTEQQQAGGACVCSMCAAVAPAVGSTVTIIMAVAFQLPVALQLHACICTCRRHQTRHMQTEQCCTHCVVAPAFSHPTATHTQKPSLTSFMKLAAEQDTLQHVGAGSPVPHLATSLEALEAGRLVVACCCPLLHSLPPYSKLPQLLHEICRGRLPAAHGHQPLVTRPQLPNVKLPNVQEGLPAGMVHLCVCVVACVRGGQGPENI